MDATVETSPAVQATHSDANVIHVLDTWQIVLYKLHIWDSVRAICGVLIVADAHLADGSPGCPECMRLEGMDSGDYMENTHPIHRR